MCHTGAFLSRQKSDNSWFEKKLSIISINNKGQQSKFMEQHVSLHN